MDSHRIPLSGLAHSLADPSTIPTIALQRVEVLADGASSIYGSDAVAGVINFITRRNYEGAETDFEYGDGLNYNQFTASQILGTHWDHGSVMLAYQYTSNSQLSGSSRSFVNDNQTFRGLSDLGQFPAIPPPLSPRPAQVPSIPIPTRLGPVSPILRPMPFMARRVTRIFCHPKIATPPSCQFLRRSQ